jgi:hypothetical protein
VDVSDGVANPSVASAGSVSTTAASVTTPAVSGSFVIPAALSFSLVGLGDVVEVAASDDVGAAAKGGYSD